MNAWWRASKQLPVGLLQLRENPSHAQPLVREHINPGLLGHWGTMPGLHFLYVHLNR